MLHAPAQIVKLRHRGQRPQGGNRSFRKAVAQSAIAFMKISRDNFGFIDKMDEHYPRFGEQYRLPFPYEPDQDDGRGM
jgi:hypothetical protein